MSQGFNRFQAERGDQLMAIVKAAVQVAVGAPLQLRPNAIECHVPRGSIDELRLALSAAGIDWQAVRREYEKSLRESGRRATFASEVRP